MQNLEIWPLVFVPYIQTFQMICLNIVALKPRVWSHFLGYDGGKLSFVTLALILIILCKLFTNESKIICIKLLTYCLMYEC